VKIANFSNSKNKLKYVYLLTPQGIAEKVDLTSRLLNRKVEEYDVLKVMIDALITRNITKNMLCNEKF
jgi:hypothetical protein